MFRSFLICYLTWSFVIVRSMYVGGICRILRYPFIWKLSIFLWSVGFNCIVSNPYGNLLLRMEWKAWTFHLIDVRALFQNNLSLLHVRVQSAIRFMISLWLSTVSVSNVPKYTADLFRGTAVPSRYLMDDWYDCFQLRVRFTHLSKFSSILFRGMQLLRQNQILWGFVHVGFWI